MFGEGAFLLLVANGTSNPKLVKVALEINAVSDSHEWIDAIRRKLDGTEVSIVKDPVVQWLLARNQE